VKWILLTDYEAKEGERVPGRCRFSGGNDGGRVAVWLHPSAGGQPLAAHDVAA
jgi:hypothetical protein